MLSLWLADFINHQGGTRLQKYVFFGVFILVPFAVAYLYALIEAWRERRRCRHRNDDDEAN